MPELPEVETIKLGLHKLLTGKKVKSVDSNWQKSFPNSQVDVDEQLIGASVKDVRRRAKVLIIDLSSNHSLVVHLKMTGQLVFRGFQSSQLTHLDAEQERTEAHSEAVQIVQRASTAGSAAAMRQEPSTQQAVPVDGKAVSKLWFGAGHPSDSLINELPDKSTRVIIEFTDKSRLFFNDQRKFGWMKLLPTNEIENLAFFQKVGPEPLDKKFGVKNFIIRFKMRPNARIKAALLDQTVIAGVGNIYADEALWAAKIHPSTKINKISNKKLEQLYKGLIDILKLSIKTGGSTDRNYVDAEGKRGSYLKFAKVFRREGQKCDRCGKLIVKIRVAGRGTHICPNCQKDPK